jgi:hypothetical protein
MDIVSALEMFKSVFIAGLALAIIITLIIKIIKKRRY